MGSLSLATSPCILLSRIMKLVAEVSSSRSRSRAPASIPSMMEAAWEVEPEALAVEKEAVAWPPGRSPIKGLMSTPVTARPSSERIFRAWARQTVRSRPSPGTWS